VSQLLCTTGYNFHTRAAGGRHLRASGWPGGIQRARIWGRATTQRAKPPAMTLIPGNAMPRSSAKYNTPAAIAANPRAVRAMAARRLVITGHRAAPGWVSPQSVAPAAVAMLWGWRPQPPSRTRAHRDRAVGPIVEASPIQYASRQFKKGEEPPWRVSSHLIHLSGV
jgi:hypothetical protein